MSGWDAEAQVSSLGEELRGRMGLPDGPEEQSSTVYSRGCWGRSSWPPLPRAVGLGLSVQAQLPQL